MNADNSDKPERPILGSVREMPQIDLAELARLCGLKVYVPEDRGQRQAWIHHVRVGTEKDWKIFNPFAADDGNHYVCWSREVLRQAVIEKAEKLGLEPVQHYGEMAIAIHAPAIGVHRVVGLIKRLDYHDRPEAEAWAEALFWLIEQEKK